MVGLTKKKKIRRVLKQVDDDNIPDTITTTEEYDEDEVDGGLLSRFTDIFSGGDLSGQGSFIGEGMGGVDGRIESPMTTITGTVAPMDTGTVAPMDVVEEDPVAKYREGDAFDQYNPFIAPDLPTTPLQEKQEFMGREDEYQRKLRESSDLPLLRVLGFPVDITAASINAVVKALGGPDSLINDPVLGSRWLIENGMTVDDIIDAARRDMETIKTVTEPIIQQLPYEEQRQTILTPEGRAAEQGLLVEDEEEIVDDAAGLLSIVDTELEGLTSAREGTRREGELSRQPFVDKGEIQEVVDTGLNPERIYADFSQDIAGKRNRYLAALNEMYKKVAILNVIASLTNSPSQATAFMQLASEKFKALEGFDDEERYQKIAQGVFFTEDGSFDAPKSKEEAFNRAIQFGATHSEAIKLSGHKAAAKTATTTGAHKTWHNPSTGQSVVMEPGQAPRGADGQILEGWFPGEADSDRGGTAGERNKIETMKILQGEGVSAAINNMYYYLMGRESIYAMDPEVAWTTAANMVKALMDPSSPARQMSDEELIDLATKGTTPTASNPQRA